MIFISHHQTTEVLQPCKEPFHFPAAFISSQWSTILGWGVLPVSHQTVWRNHFYFPLFFQFLIKTVTVVGLIADQFFRQFIDKAVIKSFIHQLHFMRRSTFDANGDRKTTAVCNCHDLGAFAFFSGPDAGPPFLADAKVPSMKASRTSIPPLSLRSIARAVSTRSKVPSLLQDWNLRWQVWYGGYRAGMSFQGAPVRNIHRIPSHTSRLFRWGRPRFPGPLSGSGSNGSMISHCLSVISIGTSSSMR